MLHPLRTRPSRRSFRSWPFRDPGLRVALVVLTVALVFGASALTADRVTTQLKQTATDEAAQGAAAIVGSFVAPLLTQDVMHDPSSGTGQAIDAELQRLVSSGYFLRIKIWDKTGTILFSDLPALRGRQFELEEDLVEALDGEVESDITDGTADENEFERGIAPRLLEIYSPVRLTSSGEVVAAYEIYRDASSIEAGLAETRRDVFLVAGAIATILAVLLLLAFDGTARRMRRQNTRLHELARTLREREARFRSLVQGGSDLILVVAHDGRIRYESPAVERILGFEPESRLDQPLEEILHPEDVGNTVMLLGTTSGQPGADVGGEARFAHHDGGWRVFEWTARNLLDEPSVEGYVLNAHDVTQRTELEEQLRHQAFHDPLTGLANRALFSDRLGHALSRRRRERDLPSVLFLDLDDFKTVNDTLGHGQGDRLLVEIARRISDSIRPEDTACRLSGDEFAVLLDEIGDVQHATEVAERVLKRISEPIDLDREVSVTASVGLAMVDAEVREVEDVLSRADVAMYAAKAAGKARVRAYEPAMRDRAWTRLELEGEMRRAVEREEFVVVYQPIVDLATGRTLELEALVRWEHPTRGRLAPDAFLAAAEETGLILPMGRLVLETACREVRAWRSAGGHATLGLSVNLSSSQFLDPDLPETLQSVLAATGLDGDTLKLEITESAMVDADASDLVMRRIRAMGIRLAVDDFGTGYSGLSYFQRFPLDTLKIDRSFVARLGRDARSDAIVDATIAFGKALGLTVTAEGVETSEQLEHLRGSGADRGQGYLFSKPLEAEAVEAFLDARHDASVA